jgi:hypothetical protein
MIVKSPDLVSIDFTVEEVRVLNKHLVECCFYGSDYGIILPAVKRIMRAKEELDDIGKQAASKATLSK